SARPERTDDRGAESPARAHLRRRTRLEQHGVRRDRRGARPPPHRRTARAVLDRGADLRGLCRGAPRGRGEGPADSRRAAHAGRPDRLSDGDQPRAAQLEQQRAALHREGIGHHRLHRNGQRRDRILDQGHGLRHSRYGAVDAVQRLQARVERPALLERRARSGDLPVSPRGHGQRARSRDVGRARNEILVPAHAADGVNQASDTALLHREFEAQARRSPRQIALEHRGASMTFAELNERADTLADVLRRERLEGGLVGLHVERSLEYVIAALAILKANAAVVPLPPSYPVERLRAILDFAKLDAVVVGEASRIDASFGARLIHVADVAAVESRPRQAPEQQSQDRPAAPAFVLSSSGSTGHPKLIVRSHESFFHRLRWTWERHPFDAGEACVQKSHMTTTHAIYELFEPLLRGVPVHIVSDDDVRQLATFWDAVHRHRVSRLLLVPSMLRASLDMPSFTAPDLRVLVLMGEYVPPALAARALEAFPRTTSIYSIYGSTEASSTLVADLRASARPGAELPLGTPISNSVEAFVLNDALEPVPSGSEGMLYIGGSALFAAYHRDPALTAAAQTNRDGRTIYRTQDRVRVRSDGALEFVGRVDDTVKIRGFRIELREVERVIAERGGVLQAVVLAHESGSGASLVGFVTPASVDVSALLTAARDSLPAYM